MPKKTTEPGTPKAPRKPKIFAPEIIAAREKCAILLQTAEDQCKVILAEARTAVRVRKLTEGMTPAQRETLRVSLMAAGVFRTAGATDKA